MNQWEYQIIDYLREENRVLPSNSIRTDAKFGQRPEIRRSEKRSEACDYTQGGAAGSAAVELKIEKVEVSSLVTGHNGVAGDSHTAKWCVASECVKAISSVEVPHPQSLVAGPGQNGIPVRVERH
jgi:hypothetical protein